MAFSDDYIRQMLGQQSAYGLGNHPFGQLAPQAAPTVKPVEPPKETEFNLVLLTGEDDEA